ncbi:MAG: hypothetical protein FJX34_04100 [Alphaproteobacteria bacterium]|nr:hypothetical protein [Alphaproteobacteria bacterium]
MTPNQIWLELTNLSSSSAFWQALGSDQFELGCSCGHTHEHEINNEKQRQIKADIDAACTNIFATPTKEDLTLILALLRMQDQIAMGKNFTSKRTLGFAKNHGITFEAEGIKIAGEPLAMPDAAEFLREKYSLNNTSEKIAAIRQGQESNFAKLQNILDVSWQDFVNEPLMRNSRSLYQNLPSLSTVLLTLGTAQMILRSFNQQQTADEVRDNIGAATEAAVFFVVANGLIENLSHSFILAAPAFGATLAYDKVRKYFREDEAEEVPAPQAPAPKFNLDSTFVTARNYQKEIRILEKVQPFLDKEELWVGLRKWQTKHQYNQTENNLKTAIPDLIGNLRQRAAFGDSILIEKHGQNLSDTLHLLKSLSEVYAKENNAGELNSLIDEFVETFAHSGILLNDPSKNAREAGFCCRAHHRLVGFDERIAESLPHLPSGSQVALAGLVISGIYAAKQIYEAATGEKEIYSDYVTDFPDHLFDWLQLGQMYQNIGGDASLSQPFRDFFASFNLAENSTHLGIAIAPFLAYSQLGSKMFEGILRRSENLAAYFSNSAGYYFDKVYSLLPNRNSAYIIHPEQPATMVATSGVAISLSGQAYVINDQERNS